MPTTFNDYGITLGAPVEETTQAPLLGVGATGEIGALRTLTHPLADSFPPIVYGVNPDLTSNLLNEALPMPIASTRRTIGTTLLTRFEAALDDVIVQETWEGAKLTKSAMPGYLLRLFYNYWLNPPELNPAAQTYIQWAPRDESDKVYNVQLVSLKVGTGDQNAAFNLKEVRFREPSAIDNGTYGWDVPFTGFIDQNVVLTMKVIGEAA